MYKSHKGPVTELHIVDQYMLEVQFTTSQYRLQGYRVQLVTLAVPLSHVIELLAWLPVILTDLSPLLSRVLTFVEAVLKDLC